MNTLRRLCRMSITASIVLLLVAFVLFSSNALVYAVVGLVPVLLVCWVARWVARRTGEPERGALACALAVACLVWAIVISVAACLALLALLVTALPRRRWRGHVLGPLALGATIVALVHPLDRWEFLGRMAPFASYWIMVAHVALLTGLVITYAMRDMPKD